MVDPAGPETTLNNFEASPFAQDHVRSWNPDIVKGNVPVALWGVIIAKNGKHPVHCDSWC